MKIQRDRKREDRLLKNLNINNLEGVHLTDLIGCMRAAYYRQTSPLPPPRVMKLYNVIGIMLQRKFYQKNNSAIEHTVAINGGEILASPDNYKESADFKSTRKFVQSENLFDDWHYQGAFYAWLYGRQFWRFDVCHIGQSFPKKKDVPYWAPSSETEGDDCKAPNLLCYQVDYEPEEIEEYVNTILDRGEQLFQYLEKKCLPPIERSWKCDGCAYSFICGLED